MTEVLSFRVSQQQKEKLRRLAIGECTTVQGVVQRLIDMAPVDEVVRSGLTLRTDGTKNKNAQVLADTGVFAEINQ